MKRGSHHSHHAKRWISLQVRKFWTPAEREKARERTLRRQQYAGDRQSARREMKSLTPSARLHNARTLAVRIAERWSASVEAIIEVGRLAPPEGEAP